MASTCAINWLSRKIGKLKERNRFVKDVLDLSGSNLAVQLLTLLALPIMARIYTSSDFGVLGIFTAIIQLITCIATFRYEIPIPNCETNRTAFNLMLVCIINTLSVTVIVFICVVLMNIFGVKFSFLSSLGWFSWLVPVAILVCCFFNILQFYAIRERLYPLISKTRFKQSLIAIFAQLGVGLIVKGATGLILGFILQIGAGGLTYLRHLLSNRAYADKSVNIRDLRETYAKHSAYFKYSTPEALFQMGALQLPLIIIGAYVNAVEAGLLFMAIRIMQVPVGIVSSSFAQVFSGSAAKSFKEGKLNELFVNTMHLMLKYAVVPVLLLGMACGTLLPVVLGEQWMHAGEIAIWLMPSVILQSLSSATGFSLYVSSNERIAFYVQFSGLILRILPTIFSVLYYPSYASYTYALTGALHYLIYFFAVSMVCKTTRKQNLELIKNFGYLLMACIIPIIAIFIIFKIF